jgi:membrane protease YdiL (CAAX protease family)
VTLEPGPSGRGEPSEAQPEPDFVRIGLLFYGVMAIVAVLWRVWLHEEPILYTSSEVEALGLSLSQDIGLGLVVGAAIVVVSHAFTRTTKWGDALARSMAEALGPISIPDAILLAFASGLAEEMFFRGALQPRVGWVAASLLFGIIHFVPRREFFPWTIFAILTGFLLGGLFTATGNLVAPIVAHFFINAVNLPWLVRNYGEATNATSESE